ncbi:MAG: PH domain-containing protein [Candidatus Heimdallarchaeota archaeon]|nr:PH domain-containing protein [Candidatus Heimdallarchaeota archaeon]
MTNLESQIIRPAKAQLKKQTIYLCLYALVMYIAILLPLGAVELSLIPSGLNLFGPLFWIILPTVSFGSIVILTIIGYILIKKRFESIQYEIKDNSINITSGFITITTRNVIFEKVINVQKIQRLLDRKFNIGTVILSTTSHSGTTAITTAFIGIEEYDELYNQFTRLLEK